MNVSSASYSLHDGFVGQRALLAVQRLDGSAAHDRRVVAREVVLRQQIANFHLDQVEKLSVVDHVALVQEHDDVRHADLARQQDVLARLRHRAVDGRHDQDRAVHLRGTRDHVLDVVGVARAVDVGIVTVRRRVLDVAGRDRQDLRRVAAALALRRLGDFVIRNRRLRPALVRRNLRQRRRQRRLAVVNVTNRADVAVRLVRAQISPWPSRSVLTHDATRGGRLRTRDFAVPVKSCADLFNREVTCLPPALPLGAERHVAEAHI